MLPEIGNIALIIALFSAILLAIFPIIGVYRHVSTWTQLAAPLTQMIFIFTLIAYLCLTYGFLTDDFSVLYVANHSNTLLPTIYKISAVWGGHEGSMLLWMLTLALWMLAVAIFSRGVSTELTALVLAILGWVAIGILCFILFTSNPFDRLWPLPADGRDLNPLLQDIGLVFHPPLLYFGYVGFSVAFAFAVASLLSGQIDSAWARWARPWTHAAWVFLTLGIALGSWWAYNELGWGGWWFWDPVENASFMPWLIGTALIHSFACTEKRGIFKAWTILLSILAFSLSLLGTFLVRSGVLTSVHAFANDPERGLFILIFLALVVGFSLTLFAIRAQTIKSHITINWFSKETLLLINNILLSVLCFSVLLGTLFPLITEVLSLEKLSVGPPYFDLIFTVIGIPLVFFIGFGFILRWKKDHFARIRNTAVVYILISTMIGFSLPLLMPFYHLNAGLGSTVAVLTILLSLIPIAERVRGKGLNGFKHINRSIYGMVVAHIGMGLFVIGVIYTNTYGIERDLRMQPGNSFEVSGYRFEFNHLQNADGPNYQSVQGVFNVYKDNQRIAQLFPEKRRYQNNDLMTEAAIDVGLHRDLYVALSEQLDNQKSWAVRIYLKPMIRFIWLGCILMALGGVLAASDKRYRGKRGKKAHSVTDTENAATSN